MRKLIIIGAIVVLVHVPSIHGQDKVIDSNWVTRVLSSYNVTNNRDNFFPAFSINELTDSVISNLVSGILRRCYRCDTEGAWRVDTIGEWESKIVIDLSYEIQCREWRDTTKFYAHIVYKAIAVEIIPDYCRLIYVSSSEPYNFHFAPTNLIEVNDRSVLYTKSPELGTGHYYQEVYWVWSKRTNSPIELVGIASDKGIVSRLTPPKHGVWKGGYFDIKTLSFKSYTWRDGDGNCCPTGGKLSVFYAIENDSLVITRAIFDYSDLEERALWSAQRSADSIYLKNPPNIYKRD